MQLAIKQAACKNACKQVLCEKGCKQVAYKLQAAVKVDYFYNPSHGLNTLVSDAFICGRILGFSNSYDDI